MDADGDRVRRARAALEIISRDDSARDRFAGAYAGAGDAVAALREVAQASADDEAAAALREQREAIQKIAFGRAQGHEEEQAAAAARRTLAEDERRLAIKAVAVEMAIHSFEPTTRDHHATEPSGQIMESDAQSSDETGPRGRSDRRSRSLWLVPIIVVSVAGGYFGATVASPGAGLGKTSASSPFASPSASPSLTPSTGATETIPISEAAGQVPGDVQAANAWFDPPQQPRDTFASIPLLSSMDITPVDTRFVQSDSQDFGVWVAKKPGGILCLLGTYAGLGYGTCTSEVDFAKQSLIIVQEHTTARWDGRTVTVSTSAPSTGVDY